MSELEIDILKEALATELKSLSISWVQRKFSLGYNKASRIVEHLEACGAVSTLEEMETLGFTGRIVRVSFD